MEEKNAFCTRCGAAVPQGAKFCPLCGTQVAAEEREEEYLQERESFRAAPAQPIPEAVPAQQGAPSSHQLRKGPVIAVAGVILVLLSVIFVFVWKNSTQNSKPSVSETSGISEPIVTGELGALISELSPGFKVAKTDEEAARLIFGLKCSGTAYKENPEGTIQSFMDGSRKICEFMFDHGSIDGEKATGEFVIDGNTYPYDSSIALIVDEKTICTIKININNGITESGKMADYGTPQSEYYSGADLDGNGKKIDEMVSKAYSSNEYFQALDRLARMLDTDRYFSTDSEFED